ncbi:MAG: allantoate amidohydrolase [Rubrobacteraceae bacterium]|nr:allantoate amidohydrolase [Rubrobacter sp.]
MDGANVMERCDALARISEEQGFLVRPYGSDAMREVNETVAGWMRGAGMGVRTDAIGNLIGRYEGTGEGTFVLGSHLDTVRDAGKYDGPLGVLTALACVERLHDRDERLPFAVEVAAFADEEGLRFGTTYLGSSHYAGAFDAKLLELEDRNGVTLADAVRTFAGDPESLAGTNSAPENAIGYCEVHIEQGPVLEERDLPVGGVSAITGLSRVQAGFSGSAGHAGTVPMEGRKDALCAAAELVLEAEAAARAEPGSVATVGEMSVRPGAGNVIPGNVDLSLDIRHGDDEVRGRLRDHLEGRAGEIAEGRGCELRWQVRQESVAVPADQHLVALLSCAIEEAGLEALRLPSGAGHDAAQMAVVCPVAMLFVRCEGGVSHNPAESVEEEDVAVTIDVMDRFLGLVADERRGR